MVTWSDQDQENAAQGNSGALHAIPEDNFEIVETRKASRPSKFTPELTEKLMAAVADGLNIKQACMAVGIGETTLHDWRQDHPGLRAATRRSAGAMPQKSPCWNQSGWTGRGLART